MQVDLLIFDLDGTLVDSKLDIANGVNHTLTTLGLAHISNEEIYHYVGHGVTDLIADAVGLHQERRGEALKIFMDYYQSHLTDHTQLFPGMQEVLDYFSVKKKAVLTNKPQGLTDLLLRQLGLTTRFDMIIGATVDSPGSGFPKKPDSASTQHILKTCDVSPQRAVIIGDSAVDIETGKNAGILTCGVTYGFRPRQELEQAGCNLIIDHPSELMRLLINIP